jgi:hypothetical protein
LTGLRARSSGGGLAALIAFPRPEEDIKEPQGNNRFKNFLYYACPFHGSSQESKRHAKEPIHFVFWSMPNEETKSVEFFGRRSEKSALPKTID